MKKINFIYIIIIIIFLALFLYKPLLIDILNIYNKNKELNQDKYITEINLLKEKVNNLEKNLNELSNLKEIDNNYYLTRLLYRELYNNKYFYIEGGKDKVKVGNILINKDGVVGIVIETFNEYSKCEYIKYVSNLTVEINNNYGILNGSKDDKLVIENINQVNLNDSVYTSDLGGIKEKLYIGKVIENKNKILVKSDIDFNKISYLYVVN